MIRNETELLVRDTVGDLGLVYTEHQHQCCDVAGDIALIKLLRLINDTESQLQYTDVASDITLCRLIIIPQSH